MVKDEVRVGYYNKAGNRIFVLTENKKSGGFFLYECQPDGSMKKIGKGKSPLELEERFKVTEKMFA